MKIYISFLSKSSIKTSTKKLREKNITITRTRPFLRLNRTLNLPFLRFCSSNERFSKSPLCAVVDLANGSRLATIEDKYSRTLVTLASWRSECNNQKILETWPETIEKWRKITQNKHVQHRLQTSETSISHGHFIYIQLHTKNKYQIIELKIRGPDY